MLGQLDLKNIDSYHFLNYNPQPQGGKLVGTLSLDFCFKTLFYLKGMNEVENVS